MTDVFFQILEASASDGFSSDLILKGLVRLIGPPVLKWIHGNTAVADGESVQEEEAQHDEGQGESLEEGPEGRPGREIDESSKCERAQEAFEPRLQDGRYYIKSHQPLEHLRKPQGDGQEGRQQKQEEQRCSPFTDCDRGKIEAHQLLLS